MMKWETIKFNNLEQISSISDESRDVIVISSHFEPKEKLQRCPPSGYILDNDVKRLLTECARVLKFGGLLFVYGLPQHLAYWGEFLYFYRSDGTQLLFKYWVALDIDDAPRSYTLKPTHLGLLMFLKSKANSSSPTPFHLNTDTVRVPHGYCTACKEHVKDWGGKKHLMNPNGVALSDVWRDLPRLQIKDHIIPSSVLARIDSLTKLEGASCLHVIQSKKDISVTQNPSSSALNSLYSQKTSEWPYLKSLESNRVYQGDCISFLEKISSLYPQGIFDLVFADPPYNLKKSYDKYEDALAEKQYIEWCNQWLAGMSKTLKPGGALIVLNLPKWAIHHAAFLNKQLEFRHWIAWDALSDPRGKIMPAHYALLYYTKPGATPTFNYRDSGVEKCGEVVEPPASPQYCLRAGCIKKRKQLNDDKKVELSDIWFDVHRIKHKRDRDAHPCQLPEKLMERIILLTTKPGDLVFDPFCGTGTTAIAAYKLGRRYVTVDLDSNYVRIATEKLAAMRQNADLFGNLIVLKRSVKKEKLPASKREIETYLQNLAQRLGKEPSESDIEQDNADMLRKIDLIYPSRLAAIKRCRVVLKGAIAS